MIATYDVLRASVLVGCVLAGGGVGALVAVVVAHVLRPRPPGRHRPR
ncbi:hypothetical protein [Actinomadura rupiterrae]|nr:hypothetical protein [Actinomadura rupiterrae]MCP2340271.1 hypothetical protein [Actinomadura rupiterrae]